MMTLPPTQASDRTVAVAGQAEGDLACEGTLRFQEEHERMELIGADREAFLQALLNPPDPEERLVAAFRRHRVFAGEPSQPMRQAPERFRRLR